MKGGLIGPPNSLVAREHAGVPVASMKGGLIGPPNGEDRRIDDARHGASMKGGLIGPPNVALNNDGQYAVAASMKGGLIGPPNLLAGARMTALSGRFNEGGAHWPPEPLALNVVSDLLVCGRLRAVMVRKHFLGRIQLSRNASTLGFMRFRALSGISQPTSALASQNDWAAGRQRDGYSHELEAVSAPLTRVTDVDHSNGVFSVMDDLS